MLGPLRHTITKEFLTLMRDPAARQMLLAAPILQVLIFSFAATLEVRNVNVAVINEDAGRWSRELIMRIDASSFIDEIIYLPSTHALVASIEQRQALVALHFPADFSRNAVQGSPAVVQAIFDGRRANAGQIAMTYIQSIVNDIRLDAVSSAAAPLDGAIVRNWFNPNLEYKWFIVPALVATLALIPALLIATLGVARDRELGTFDQLVVSPVSTLEIILGKILPAVLAGMLSGTLVFLLAIYAYKVGFTGSLSLLFLSMIVFVFAVAGIGLAVSAACNTQQQALMGVFSLISPMMITSGFVSPVENMPEALQYVAEINPLKHFMIIVQGSFLKAMTPAELLFSLWPMLVVGSLTVGTAALIIRWRLQ